MKQRKSYDFSAIGRSIEREMNARRAYDPTASEAIRRAAVQASFLDGELPLTEQDRAYLTANTQSAGERRTELKDSTRNEVLRALQSASQLTEVYDRYARPWEVTDTRQRIFGRVLRGEEINLQECSVAELNALFRIRFWVDGLGYEVPEGGTIRGALSRLEIREKFRRQTANFSGRKNELRQLGEYVDSVSEAGEDMMSRPPLLVYGVGGVGKSTLISRFLLRKITQDNSGPLPFVYLDFDHPGLSISDPLALFAAGLRQLVAQFPAATGKSAPLENALSDLLATEEMRGQRAQDGKAEMQLSSKVGRKSSARSWDRILGNLSDRHLSKAESEGWAPERPILIVLDSFEEAQYRTGETEIRNFLEFINRLTDRLPNLRLVIVGRSDLVVSPFTFAKLEVGDFDEAAALAYLENCGVPDKELRQIIFDQTGGNPLTLKLAAALAEQYEYGKKITNQGFKALLAGTQVQELLVRRNIEHIRDAEVRVLALPGMLLRRIDAEVIQHVLAPVCGLGDIDRTKAYELFAGLQRVTFLVEQRNGELHFRRDLRIALRDEIWRKERDRCLDLHRAAMDYYKDFPEAKNVAEQHYHRFQLDGKVWPDADQVDWKSLRPFLEDTLLELPPQAAAYLARQFGVRLPYAIMKRAGREENDWAMIRRIEEVAVNGVGGLTQMEEVWTEVADRTDSNEFFFIYYRELLAIRLGRFDRVLTGLSPRSEAKLRKMSDYLKLLLNNYQQDYETGIQEANVTSAALTPQQVLESGALYLKFLALAGLPYDEAFAADFSQAAAINQDDELTETHAAELFRRAFTLRLWDVRRTDRPLEREQFTGLCRAIYAAYAQVGKSYSSFADEIRDVDQKRFGLVLQNETGKLMEDIAAPGAPRVVAQDYLDFLVEFYGGDYDKIEDFIQRAWGEVKVESEAPSPTPRAVEADNSALEEQRKNVIWRARDFLKKGKIELAIGQLISWAKTHKQDEYINPLLVISSEWSKITRDSLQGVATGAETDRRRNHTTQRLLLLIDEVEQDG